MSLDNAAMTVYGDSISGNCLKIKFVADQLGIPYEWVETSVMKKQSRTPEFLALNPAGQVPVVVFAGNGPLAQSNAVMLCLAEGSNLIPADAFARARMFQWLFWEQHSHEPAIAVLRFHRHYLKTAEIDPALVAKCESVLTLMDNHLGSCDYFVGECLSLADIALVAYTRFSHEAALDLARWPKLRAWVRHVESDLNIEHAGG